MMRNRHQISDLGSRNSAHTRALSPDALVGIPTRKPRRESELRVPRGFTVLFATLIAALLLAVGLAIFDIIFKEVSFATVVRDSNYALYAADTGAECVLYWDYKCNDPANAGVCSMGAASAFASSTASVPPVKGVVCDGQDVVTGGSGGTCTGQPGGSPGCAWDPGTGPDAPSANAATTTFTFLISQDQSLPYCTSVQVLKNKDTLTGRTVTQVISRGYNTCDTNNQNRIERGYVRSY